MSFRMAKSRLTIGKDGDMGRPNGRLDDGSAGRGGASRGFWSLTGTGRSLQKAFRTPCSPKGGGGFKGYRLCRRPLLNQVQVILCDL